MEILLIRHNWPEPAGFTLNRPQGAKDYILLHFHNSVKIAFGGRQHVTMPGAFILFSPETPHSFVSHEQLVHDWMHLSGDVEADMNRLGLACNRLYHPSCGSYISQITAELEAEFFARRSHWHEYCDARLTQLMITLSRDLQGEAPLPVAHETADALRALRARMLLHPEQQWTNAAMAQAVGISTSRLYPLYRRMFAISPNHDLILMRIEKAKNMLSQGCSVIQAADALGYANVFHFIRQFKQIAGTTPGQYAK